MLLTPTSSNRFHVLSLTEYNSGIWSDPDQTRTYLRAREGIHRDTLVWDLQKLADRYFSLRAGAHRSLSASDDAWHPIFLSSYREAAASIIRALPSPQPVPAFTEIAPDAFVTAASISLRPLLAPAAAGLLGPASAPSVHAAAEAAVMQACCVPGAPFLLASSLPGHRMFGPLFFESIEFATNGNGRAGIVEVAASLKGGRTVVSPDMGDRQEDLSELNGWAPAYRSATVGDCAFAFEAVLDPVELYAGMALGSFWGVEEIVSMSLSVRQRVAMAATANPVGRTDFQGPRYAKVSQREVTGKIEYYSSSNASPFTQVESVLSLPLTMYFGGTFLFVMENVDFGRPTVAAEAGRGYVHSVPFVARAANGSVSRRVEGDEPLSEFAYVGV